MRSLIILTSVVLVCLRESNVVAYSLPGPRVYVVTPSPRPLQNDEGSSAPFYYHNWMRRMDNDMIQNTTSSTTKTPKVKTPDLIFAEFESDNNDGMKKSIRKLLEKEKIVPPMTSTTTSRPIYVPDEELKEPDVVNYGIPNNVKLEDNVESISNNPADYYSMYNNLYNDIPSPVFMPSTIQTTSMNTITTTTIAPEIHKVQNIWHIIDSEKGNQYSGNWEEIPIESKKQATPVEHQLPIGNNKTIEQNDGEDDIDENFALPGFGSNSGNGAENESRAIRYEPNIRFPYVNLKTFQLKPSKKPLYNTIDNKNGNSLMTSLDNFHDLKNPVRGEAQDLVPTRNIIDRYNPAQPYLPPSDYGSKISKQNSISTPSKATSMLVPPPPPPIPKKSGNDFPILTNPYESFPPYAPISVDSAPPPPPSPIPSKPSISIYSPPTIDMPDDSDSNTDSDNLSPPMDSPMDVGYGYNKPPAPSLPKFLPTSPPVSKPFTGYSYDKPPMPAEVPMMPSMVEKPEFQGYHYKKPEPIPPQNDHVAPSYGHHDASPIYSHDGHDTDYPELIFQKHHGNMDDSKGNDDMNGMVPPPMDMKPADHGPPMDDHGFPSDFPDDFKYHHDFDDDHDFYHHHHHHTTTTTTTTEMPRVNRYSYYYLGKKLYYLPLYFSVYFIVYVGALIIKAVLRHKIVYPNSWRPNSTTASFFSKRSVDAYLSNDNLHEVTGRVTHAIANAAEKYLSEKYKNQ